MALSLTAAPGVWQGIISHAIEECPQECCGILVGHENHVTHAIPCANVAEGNRTRNFLIDPEALLRGQRDARASGSEIIGFFHSHPGRTAHWSKSDAAGCWPGTWNVVVSIRDQRVAETHAYFVDNAGAVTQAPFEPC